MLCLQEMSALFACYKKHDFAEAPCGLERTALSNCHATAGVRVKHKPCKDIRYYEYYCFSIFRKLCGKENRSLLRALKLDLVWDIPHRTHDSSHFFYYAIYTHLVHGIYDPSLVHINLYYAFGKATMIHSTLLVMEVSLILFMSSVVLSFFPTSPLIF